MDARGRVVGWNRAAEETFGYARADAVGRSLGDLIVPDTLREAHARTAEQIAALRELDVDFAQGYLLRRPAPADRIAPAPGRILARPRDRRRGALSRTSRG